METLEEEKRLILDGTEEPDALSVYTMQMKFGLEFITTMGVEGINTVIDAMNNVPLFCSE